MQGQDQEPQDTTPWVHFLLLLLADPPPPPPPLPPPPRCPMDSLNVHGKPPCVHPRLGLAGDNVPNAVSKAGHGFRPRDSLPNFCSLSCLRQSFKVDLLIRCITVSCENILMVAPIPVACSGKVNACQYVHHTRRTCEHA